MSVLINNETIYPQSLIELVRTTEGLNKVLNYLELKKAEHMIRSKKCSTN